MKELDSAMSQTNKKTVIEEVEVSDADNSPSVVAYRVGKLEEAVTAGFVAQAEKIDKIVEGFVTEKEMTEAKSEAKDEHVRIWNEIDRIKGWGVWAVRLIGGALILGLLVVLGFKAGLGS